MSFLDDVSQKNISAYPVVRISNSPGDDVYISTNSVKYNNNYCLPILLNVPGLKESIDVESRKYKISNVTLNISNYESNGSRFSELFTDSLINKEVDIMWVSQSNNYISVYKGVIRRYDMNTPDNVKLTVEDRSQATLHKDLPLENVGSLENIPDKYKNQYVPLIMGSVDRSPIIPHYSYNEEISNEEGEVQNLLEFRLKADTQAVSFEEQTVTIGTAEHRVSALYFYENDGYHNVHKTNASLGESTESGVANFRYGDTDIVLDVDGTEYGAAEDEEVLLNDFVLGHLRVHAIRRFNKVEFEYASNGSTNYEDNINHDLGNGIGRIYGNYNVRIQTAPGESPEPVLLDYSSAHLKCILEPITVPNNIAVDEEGVIIAPTTRLLIDVTHYNFRDSDSLSPHTGDNIPAIANTFGLNNPDVPAETLPSTHWGAWAGQGHVAFGTSSSYVGQGAHGVLSANSQQTIFPYDFNNIGTNTIGSTSYEGDEIDLLSWFKTLTSFDYVNIGIPYVSWSLTSDVTQWEGSGQLYPEEADDTNWGVDTTINDAFIVQTYLVMGITDKDYYANVMGREGDAPTAPNIISNILTEELSIDTSVGFENIGNYPYYDEWKYAFTVHEKINSKKLLEGIASASPYIPHFNNQGGFKLDVIKKQYTKEHDINQATHIEEADCISWSYSRTKIEDVYTRVDLKYKFDYGRKEFSKSFTTSIFDEGIDGEVDVDFTILTDLSNGGYELDYYGITDSSESTLVIDDDRGKYIRDPETAKAFAEWILRWHCNQHLKVKVRLSLKYLNIAVGELVAFPDVLGDVYPYNVDYSIDSTHEGTMFGSKINGQQAFPLFFVTSTNKTLDYVEIECNMLHNLSNLTVPVDAIIGCMVEGFWNSDDSANIGGSCYNEYSFMQDDCPFQANPTGDEAGTANADYSTNYEGADLTLPDSFLDTEIEEAETYFNDTDIFPRIYSYSTCLWQDTVYHQISAINVEVFDGVNWHGGTVGGDQLQVTINWTDNMQSYYDVLGIIKIKTTFYFVQNLPTFSGDSTFKQVYKDWNYSGEGDFGTVLTEIENYNVYSNSGYEETIDIPSEDYDLIDGTNEIRCTYTLQVSPDDETYYEIPQTERFTLRLLINLNDRSGIRDDATGDVTGDGNVDILDLVRMVNIVINEEDATDTELAAGDMNSNGELDIYDLERITNIVLEN